MRVMCFVSDVMVGMGFSREEIKDALVSRKYNDITATYLLLGRKNEVSSASFFLNVTPTRFDVL